MAEIILNSEFGRAIFLTVRTLHLRSVLEIGSYDGDGSTQVLIESLLPFKQKRLVCLEMRSERHANLCANTKAWNWVEANCAPSVSWESFSCRDFETDVWPGFHSEDPELHQTVKGWWEEDVRMLRESEREAFLDTNEESFDGVLIDGGEFSGYDEFRLLRDKTKCFILDDVFKVFKNRKVYESLRSDPEWACIQENREERNGTAIFCRKDFLPPAWLRGFRKGMALIAWRFAITERYKTG